MNYIELLKSQGKMLVINGPPGSGKTLLSSQLACDDVNVTINYEQLASNFCSWLESEPTVIIINVDRGEVTYTFDIVKRFMKNDCLRCDVKYKDSKLVCTPFFILNTNYVYREIVDNEVNQITVINIGDRK